MKENRNVDKADIVEIATNVLDKYDVYVVNGKPIAIKNHVLDVDNSEHWADIVSTVGELFCVPDLPAIYEDDTICIFVPSGDEICGGECCRAAISIADMSGFPVDVVEKCKLAILKQKNQVVDIDGYIHVINGKVICFKPDVYDLNNSEDVESLIEYSKSLFSCSHLKPLYGDQTMYILEHVSDTMHNIFRGDINVFLTNFSEDVQEQVRSAVNEYRGETGN